MEYTFWREVSPRVCNPRRRHQPIFCRYLPVSAVRHAAAKLAATRDEL